MTVLTDVPESGIYTTQGAIIEIVAQLVDINTDEPIQIQTATNLIISLLYPDGTTSRDLTASLYTDGSDGRIKYVTLNDGASNIDLNQVGLYRFQAKATIGGVPLPASLVNDFYVQSSINAGSIPPLPYTSSALISFDPSHVRWALTIDTGGGLHWAAQLTGPSNSLTLNQIVMKDADGIYWTIQADGSGGYTAVQGGDYSKSIDYFVLVDSDGVSWVVTVSTSGALTPS